MTGEEIRTPMPAVSPAILTWARETANLSLEDAAQRPALKEARGAPGEVASEKSGGSQKRFYKQLIAKADLRFSLHLEILKAAKKGT